MLVLDFQTELDTALQALADGENDRAVLLLEKLQTEHPSHAELLSGLGLGYLRLGRHDNAKRIFDECLLLDPRNHDALLYRGIVEMQEQKWAKALGYFESLIAFHPQSFKGSHQAGLCLAHLGHWKKSEPHLKLALDLFPSSADIQIDLAITLFYAGRAAESTTILKETVRQNPRNSRAPQILFEITKSITKAQQ